MLRTGVSDARMAMPWCFLPRESSQKVLHPPPSWGNRGLNETKHKSQSNPYLTSGYNVGLLKTTGVEVSITNYVLLRAVVP